MTFLTSRTAVLSPVKPWPWLTLAGGLLIAAGAFAPALHSINLVVLSVLAAAILCGWDREGLLAAFLLSGALIHLLKRMIFLFGPQPQALYYGIQAIPAALLALLLALAVRRRFLARAPASALLLLAYLLVASASTAASLKWSSPAAAGGAFHQQLLPALMYFVSCALPARDTRKALLSLCLLGAVSTLYGALQLLSGPTPIDRAWAEEVHSYSIQGGKVLAYVQGTNNEFRGYSFYADPLTWGLLLLAVLTAGAIARELRFISGRVWRFTLAATTVGLFCAMTRTTWIGLFVMLGVLLLIRKRTMARAWPLFLLSVCLFALTVGGGGYLYREFFLTRRVPVFENPLLRRYATVGTVEARITAWEEFKTALSNATLIGRGNSVLTQLKEIPSSELGLGTGLVHNVAVQLVAQNGLAGFLLYVLFFAQWLREAARNARRSRSQAELRCVQWILAYAVASLVTGYWNGNCYMTYYYWFFLGLGSGTAFRAGEAAWANAPGVPGPGRPVDGRTAAFGASGPGARLARRTQEGIGSQEAFG